MWVDNVAELTGILKNKGWIEIEQHNTKGDSKTAKKFYRLFSRNNKELILVLTEIDNVTLNLNAYMGVKKHSLIYGA